MSRSAHGMDDDTKRERAHQILVAASVCCVFTALMSWHVAVGRIGINVAMDQCKIHRKDETWTFGAPTNQ